MTRANLSIIVEIGSVVLSTLRTDDERRRIHVESLLLLRDRHELDEIAHIPNHHSSEQVLPVLGEEVLLVGSSDGILEDETLDLLLLLRNGLLDLLAVLSTADDFQNDGSGRGGFGFGGGVVEFEFDARSGRSSSRDGFDQRTSGFVDGDVGEEVSAGEGRGGNKVRAERNKGVRGVR